MHIQTDGSQADYYSSLGKNGQIVISSARVEEKKRRLEVVLKDKFSSVFADKSHWIYVFRAQKRAGDINLGFIRKQDCPNGVYREVQTIWG